MGLLEDVQAEGMKKKPGPKNGSSHTAMNLANGTQKIKDRNFGIFLTAKKIWVNTLGFFL